MTSMLQAWRALARRPLFTVATLLTMTAGIGVTTAVFSIVDRVLIRPLPFPDGDQLVSVYEASPSRQERTSLVAPARLADWNRLTRAFEVISGSYSESITDTSGAEPERLEGRRVMPRFFEVFGMAPLAGRTFVADEERFGGALNGRELPGHKDLAIRQNRDSAHIAVTTIARPRVIKSFVQRSIGVETRETILIRTVDFGESSA